MSTAAAGASRISSWVIVAALVVGCRSATVGGGAPPVGGEWISVEEFGLSNATSENLLLDIDANGYLLSGAWTLGPISGPVDGGSSQTSSGVSLVLDSPTAGTDIRFSGSLDGSLALLQGALNGSAASADGSVTVTLTAASVTFARR